jgi:hypothetical protein
MCTTFYTNRANWNSYKKALRYNMSYCISEIADMCDFESFKIYLNSDVHTPLFISNYVGPALKKPLPCRVEGIANSPNPINSPTK